MRIQYVSIAFLWIDFSSVCVSLSLSLSYFLGEHLCGEPRKCVSSEFRAAGA